MVSWDTLIWQNSLLDWLRGILICVFTYFLLVIIRRIIRRRGSRLAAQTSHEIDNLVIDLVKRTKPYFLLILSVYAGSLVLTLPEIVGEWLRTLLIVIALLQAAFWGLGLIDHLVRRATKTSGPDEVVDATTGNALKLVARIALWSVVSLLILENLTGVEVNALIASLGVGGIAVALAVQNVLGDLFASLTIALDKPFAIGDMIAVDDFQGKVEHIGLKSTRVRSVSGEQVVFSNSDLLSSRIRNYGRMERRRVVFTLGLSYQTASEKLKMLPGLLRQIMEELPEIDFSRVHLKEYGSSAINFECAYFVNSAEVEAYLDAQQAVNYGILQTFEEHGVDFAGAATTIVVESVGEVPKPSEALDK